VQACKEAQQGTASSGWLQDNTGLLAHTWPLHMLLAASAEPV
jgi:hypothetical protein